MGLSSLLSVTRDQVASGQPALGQTLLWVTLPILSRELQAKIVEAEVLLTVLFLLTSLLNLGFSALPHTSSLLHLNPILLPPPPTTRSPEHQDWIWSSCTVAEVCLNFLLFPPLFRLHLRRDLCHHTTQRTPHCCSLPKSTFPTLCTKPIKIYPLMLICR